MATFGSVGQKRPRARRVAGALLLVVSACIHLGLYLTGYRSIPTIGWLFLEGRHLFRETKPENAQFRKMTRTRALACTAYSCVVSGP
jgi:hypothetical protein